MAVGIYNGVGFFKAECACFRIYIPIVGNHVDHFGNEHMMNTQFDDLFHLAFDTDGRFGQDGCFHDRGRGRGQSHFLPFIVFGTRSATTPIGCTGQFLGGQIDHVFARALNDFVGVAARANRNVTHGWVTADGSCPCNGNQVILFGRFTASHQYRRKGINHCSGFPIYFCHYIVALICYSAGKSNKTMSVIWIYNK